MRIPSFTTQNYRGVKYASCTTVPQIMLITGPNGCGKSTLLDALRTAGGTSGPILYVGPHRISGRQQVRMRFLVGQKLLMRDLQANKRLPNYEGINIRTRQRSAWDFDETSSYLKYALCQIELDRQAALTERFDNQGEVNKDSMPDVWMPLKEMTENLLPHLQFERIDITDRDQIQCLWNIHSKDIQVDIDDLSSGEKAIIQLFFPLIENRIQALISQCKDGIRSDTRPNQGENVCVLMDEPEMHLHPNLQGKILSYLRSLATRERIQFILATHSVTIVEQANSVELFLLRPAEMVGMEENQLVRIASSDEKLHMMREVFGSTSNITAMRKILVVEGDKARGDSKRASDERIFGFLSDKFAQLTILSGGGKSECKVLAQSLCEVLSNELSSSLRAVALVDRDLDSESDEDGFSIRLPVAMVENFLVDPDVIWTAIVTVRHKTQFRSQDDVEGALDVVLSGMAEEEIARRVKAGIGFFGFRLRDPICTAEAQVSEHVKELKEAVADSVISELKSSARDVVDELLHTNRRREQFSGKSILTEFYRKHLHNTGMSKEIFVYECAQAASKRSTVRKFVQEILDKIGLS